MITLAPVSVGWEAMGGSTNIANYIKINKSSREQRMDKNSRMTRGKDV